MKKRSSLLMSLLILSVTLSGPMTRATVLVGERPAAAFKRAPLPDLIIQSGNSGSAKVASDGNTYVTNTFVVSNIGQATSGRCKARLYLAYKTGGAPNPRYVDLDVGSLSPAGKTTITYKYNYPTKGPASYVVRAVVDPENQVEEMDEKNN